MINTYEGDNYVETALEELDKLEETSEVLIQALSNLQDLDNPFLPIDSEHLAILDDSYNLVQDLREILSNPILEFQDDVMLLVELLQESKEFDYDEMYAYLEEYVTKGEYSGDLSIDTNSEEFLMFQEYADDIRFAYKNDKKLGLAILDKIYSLLF